jgi:hypothetical protein
MPKSMFMPIHFHARSHVSINVHVMRHVLVHAAGPHPFLFSVSTPCDSACPSPSCLSMYMLHVHFRSTCPCLCCMSRSKLHCCLSMSMPYVYVHAACPLYGIGHAAWTSICCLSLSMSMLHVHVDASCQCQCCLSISMPHVYVHAACPCINK